MTFDELAHLLRDIGGFITTSGKIHARYVAKLLDRDRRTLRLWRSKDRGPPCSGSWYDAASLAAWLDSEECPQDFRSRESGPLSARSLRTHAHTRPIEPCSIRRRVA